jgi:small subunit ribosomal protein S20
MRATVGRTLRNKSVRSAVKTRVVRVRRAIAEHTEGVTELGIAAIASLDRAANKGILHANNAGRRKSRLMKALNAAEKAPSGEAVVKPVKAKAAAAKPVAKAARPAATRVKAPTRPAAKASSKPAAKAKPAKPAAKKR